MKKSTMSIAVAAALFSMTSAQASEFDGLYLGGKVGVNNSNITGIPAAASKNASTFGIEEGYNWDMGKFLVGADFFVDFNQKTTHTMTPVNTGGVATIGNYSSSALGLDLKLGLPTGNWMPYAKMGWDRTTGSVAYANASFKYTNHLHLGVGLEYKFAPHWSVAGEWTRTSSKATAATLNNDNFTIGLNYYFGAAPAPAAAVVAPVVAAVAPVVKKEEVKPVVAPVVKKEEVKPVVYKTIFSDKPVTIEGASFDTGSARLKPAANAKLNQVVDFAAKNKDANLTVTGYTDNRGSAKLNEKLSAKRAGSVKAYLVKKGVDAKRIAATGKGMANPIGDNKTNAGRAMNRRVEINSVVKEEKKVRAD